MRALVIVILVALTAAPALGQGASLEPGVMLRLRSAGGEIEGSLVRLGSDSVVVWVPPSSGRPTGDVAIDLSAVERMQVGSDRSRGAGALRSAGIVGLTGLLIGVVLGSNAEPGDKTFAMASVGGMLGGIGAAIGAVGGAISPGTRWDEVPLEPTPRAEQR